MYSIISAVQKHGSTPPRAQLQQWWIPVLPVYSTDVIYGFLWQFCLESIQVFFELFHSGSTYDGGGDKPAAAGTSIISEYINNIITKPCCCLFMLDDCHQKAKKLV